MQHADRGPKADRVLKHRMHPSRSPQHRPLRRRPRPRRTGSSSCPSVEPDPHWAVPLSVHAHPGASGERALFCLARRPRRLPRRPPPSTGRRPGGRATTEVQYQDSTWCPARHAGYPKGRLNRLPDGLPTRRWPTRDDGRRGRGKGRSLVMLTASPVWTSKGNGRWRRLQPGYAGLKQSRKASVSHSSRLRATCRCHPTTE